MRLLTAIKDRLRIWRLIFWGPFSTAVAAIYATLGVATFTRDNFLPPNIVAQLQILKYLPSWSLLGWLGVALLGAWMITLEGAYQLVSTERQKVQRLEGKLKAKYEREEIIVRLRAYVAEGYQLIVKVEDYKDADVTHVFDREDEIETWVMDVYQFLVEALPQHATAFLGDFEKYRKDWQRRRTDSEYRATVQRRNVFGQVGTRQFWGGWIKAKIAQIEGFMS